MNSAREKGSAELEKYADEQAAEIKADLDKKRAETMKQLVLKEYWQHLRNLMPSGKTEWKQSKRKLLL